jgi:hypothetical protein
VGEGGRREERQTDRQRGREVEREKYYCVRAALQLVKISERRGRGGGRSAQPNRIRVGDEDVIINDSLLQQRVRIVL